MWVIEYATDSEITIAGATSGNGDYPQSTAGTLIMQFTDDGGVPGDGPAGILYSRSPTQFTIDTILGDISTDVVVTGGSASESCPVATGVLSGTQVTWDACAYLSDDWGTNDFDPGDQLVDDDEDAGCVPVHSEGNVHCSGFVCVLAGLKDGDNFQDDDWDQPVGQTIVDFGGFAGGSHSSVSFGGSSYTGSPFYPDSRDSPTPGQASTKTESPTNTDSRLWRSAWTVSEVSRACVPPPTGCD